MTAFLQAGASIRYFLNGEKEGIEYEDAEFLEDFGVFKKGDKFEKIIISITTGEIITYKKHKRIVQPFALVPITPEIK